MNIKSKLTITLSIALIASSLFGGCAKKTPEVAKVSVIHESRQYVATGRYYTNGTVVTSDGNEWDYETDLISQKKAYDSEPVYIIFDDNGTEDNIYDDAILGLVLNRETAIYDALETELSESFAVERTGNTLKIGTK